MVQMQFNSMARIFIRQFTLMHIPKSIQQDQEYFLHLLPLTWFYSDSMCNCASTVNHGYDCVPTTWGTRA